MTPLLELHLAKSQNLYLIDFRASFGLISAWFDDVVALHRKMNDCSIISNSNHV